MRVSNHYKPMNWVLNARHPLARDLRLAVTFDVNGRAYDHSTLRHSLAISGTIQSPVYERLGRAYQFGSNYFTGANRMAIGGRVTVACRLACSAGTQGVIWTRGSSPYSTGLDILIESNKYRTIWISSGGGSFDFYAGSVTVTDGAWRSFASTLNVTQGLSYINGEQLGSQSTTAITTLGTNDIEIGRRGGAGALFAGKMSYVYVWNRVLSPQEIAQLHATPFEMFAGSRAGIKGQSTQYTNLERGIRGLNRGLAL